MCEVRLNFKSIKLPFNLLLYSNRLKGRQVVYGQSTLEYTCEKNNHANNTKNSELVFHL